jgi:hypothetical protein
MKDTSKINNRGVSRIDLAKVLNTIENRDFSRGKESESSKIKDGSMGLS